MPTANPTDEQTLVLLDNGYEQRTYRTPKAAAAGVSGYLTPPVPSLPNGGRVLVYRLDEEASTAATREAFQVRADMEADPYDPQDPKYKRFGTRWQALFSRIW